MENLANGPFRMQLQSELEQFFLANAQTKFLFQIRWGLYRLVEYYLDNARDAFARSEGTHAKEEI